jgi:hypothetical protein
VPNADRHRLHFGPYGTPVFEYGDVVIGEARGQVAIVGLCGGRISGPFGERNEQKWLVLCGGFKPA